MAEYKYRQIPFFVVVIAAETTGQSGRNGYCSGTSGQRLQKTTSAHISFESHDYTLISINWSVFFFFGGFDHMPKTEVLQEQGTFQPSQASG